MRIRDRIKRGLLRRRMEKALAADTGLEPQGIEIFMDNITEDFRLGLHVSPLSPRLMEYAKETRRSDAALILSLFEDVRNCVERMESDLEELRRIEYRDELQTEYAAALKADKKRRKRKRENDDG